MNKKSPLFAALAFSFHLTAAQATLIDTGFGAVYSTEADITLLKNISYVEKMNWYEAVAWADSLTFGGHSNWRLPSHGGCRNNEWICNDMGEIGVVYYTELGIPFDPYPSQPVDFDKIDAFKNIRTGLYWFSEDDTDNPAEQAWYFSLDYGSQDSINKSQLHTAWAVADGDVFGVAVMEPSSFILMTTGLAWLGFTNRKKKPV